MTRPLSFRHRPRGFTLIEVMIAVLVLATGFLALTALQGALIRSSADSKTRSQIATYAASELDRFRLTQTISSGTFTADPVGSAPEKSAFAAGVSELRVTPSLTRYVADAAGVFSVMSPRGPTDDPYFDRVTLNIGWTDATGDSTRSLVFVTDVSPLALTASKILVDRIPPDDQGLRPIVRRPIPLTEGMIPIAVSGSQDTAATNPKPQLVGRDNNTLVADTRFDLLTFTAGDNMGVSGYVRFDKKIETAMVGCTCQMGLAGFPTGGSAPAINSFLRAKAYRPSYWAGTDYSEPKAATYSPGRSPDNSAPQSQLCDVCCRDHEDGRTGTTGPKFNPWVTGAHGHYLDLVGPVTTGSGSFDEACRVIRVNGVWRVTPDPKTMDIALLPTNVHPITATAPTDNSSATSPLVSVEGRDSYVSFAYDFIKEFFYDGTYTDTDANRAAMHTAAGLNEPEYVPIKPGDKRWLHARAILTDFLESAAVARINKAKSECTAPDPVTVPEQVWRAQCVLPYSPMATINATELAKWSGRENSETGITLSGSLATSITNYGQALLNRFVSALALVGAVNPDDAAAPIKDEQTFALVPPTVKTGTWLTVATPADVIFGDPTQPKRGFATLSAPIRFNATFNGIPYAHDNTLGNDPAVNVGISSPSPCSHGSGSDPTHDGAREAFDCQSDSTSNVILAFGGMNYLQTTNLTGPNVASTCSGTPASPGRQAKCVYHTLTSVVVDAASYTPAGVGYQVRSGTLTKPSEVSSITIPSVRGTAPESDVTLTFSQSEFNATQSCLSNTFVGWTCN